MPDTTLPLARTEELVVEEVGDETLVHDLRNHKTHCLNAPAALIFRHCDGSTRTSAMAALLEEELGKGDPDFVQYGLEVLGRNRLVEAPAPSGLSRRQMLSRAAILVPIVASVTVPGRAGVSAIDPEDCGLLVGGCPAIPCLGQGELCIDPAQIAQGPGVNCACIDPNQDPE